MSENPDAIQAMARKGDDCIMMGFVDDSRPDNATRSCHNIYNQTQESTTKPRPGKLDLSQFDNITNAIGKLHVQSRTSRAGSETAVSVLVPTTTRKATDDHVVSSGLFGGKARKPKQRNKSLQSKFETPSGDNSALMGLKARKVDGSVNDLINNRKNSDSKETVVLTAQRKLSDDVCGAISVGPPKPSIVNLTSQEFRNDSLHNDQTADNNLTLKHITLPMNSIMNSILKDSITSSTPQSSRQFRNDMDPTRRNVQSTPEVVPPRPAPRSSHGFIGGSSPNTSSHFTHMTSSMTKRAHLNHGRAVAPPQLPGSIQAKSIEACNNTSDQTSHNIHENVIRTKDTFDISYDCTQSPIAQRHLRHLDDHKVSELSSPCDSDEDNQAIESRTPSSKDTQRPAADSPSATIFRNTSIDCNDLIAQRGAAIKQLNEILANKQLPGRPGGPMFLGRSFSHDQHDQQSAEPHKKGDKEVNKKDKKKTRDEEKLEKRRLKDEERMRKQEKKLAEKKNKSKISQSSAHNDDSGSSDGLPLFVKRCIEFIESEGLDAEGIYRVPGNRAHVDAFVQKFKTNASMSITDADIPVNAVATALKDYLSKKCSPIIPLDMMDELIQLASIANKELRLQAIRNLIRGLPSANYKLLKFVIAHFHKVSMNHASNSMDSKNLAICWWPTLLPLNFSDMVMFEQMRPHLEESIQTMIDNHNLIFDDDISPEANYDVRT